MNTVIFNEQQINLTITRLAYELIENHGNFSETILLGIQPRGGVLGNRMVDEINKLYPHSNVSYGLIDPTFHRDDFRRKEILMASVQRIDFSIENKKVVLIDDVLYTGRTIRATLDALMDLGRPYKVELLVLVDRRYNRDLPIQADYIGYTMDTRADNRIKVDIEQGNIELIKN